MPDMGLSHPRAVGLRHPQPNTEGPAGPNVNDFHQAAGVGLRCVLDPRRSGANNDVRTDPRSSIVGCSTKGRIRDDVSFAQCPNNSSCRRLRIRVDNGANASLSHSSLRRSHCRSMSQSYAWTRLKGCARPPLAHSRSRRMPT